MGEASTQIGLGLAILSVLFSTYIMYTGFKNIKHNTHIRKNKIREKVKPVINMYNIGIAVLFMLAVSYTMGGLESTTPIAMMFRNQLDEVILWILFVGLAVMLFCTFSAEPKDYDRVEFGDTGLLMTSCYFYSCVSYAYIATYFGI